MRPIMSKLQVQPIKFVILKNLVTRKKKIKIKYKNKVTQTLICRKNLISLALITETPYENIKDGTPCTIKNL